MRLIGRIAIFLEPKGEPCQIFALAVGNTPEDIYQAMLQSRSMLEAVKDYYDGDPIIVRTSPVAEG